jgi:tetratricopeptide (TPR) repeat protein
MKALPSVLTLVAAAFACLADIDDASARFRRPDLANIPVERLAANLEKHLGEKPKDVAARYNLARLHAMAFASKADSVQFQKDRENAGAWFGYTPAHVPFKLKESKDPKVNEAARKQLEQAIAEYKKVIELKKNHLGARLGLAWCLEQSGDKKAAIDDYRKLIDDAWKKEGTMKFGRLGGHFITAEAVGYLVPLLDQDKDKTEIAELEQRAAKLKKLPRPVTPIVVPLDEAASVDSILDRRARVRFDADGSGLRNEWTWITPHAAWLVHDPQQAGRVTSATQLFGSATFNCFWENGYRALASLDDDGDGRLAGAELRGLSLWHDRNADGKSDSGEVRPLAEYGIRSLDCRGRTDGVPRGCAAFAPRGIVFESGASRPTYDVVLSPRS